jgi:NDP-sugar pyrophosphorylase family protein
MQMVIICGGLGTRLGHLTKYLPKSMIQIEGKPFLEYQIENLKKQSITDIVLCVGYQSEKIEEYFGNGIRFGVNIKYSFEKEKLLGQMGAVKNAEPLLQDTFFIMYGDSYLSVDLHKVQNFFMQHDKPALMVVYKNHDKYDRSNIIIQDNMVVGYGEKQRTRDMIYIDYGTSVFRKKVLDYTPKDTPYSTEQFFSDLIKKQELMAFESQERFYHIGNPEALEEFRNYIMIK